MKEVRENLLAVAVAYMKATGRSSSTVGHDFHGNQAFFEDFRKGKISITLAKAEKMLEQFREKWPTGTPWPAIKSVSMGRRGKLSVEAKRGG